MFEHDQLFTIKLSTEEAFRELCGLIWFEVIVGQNLIPYYAVAVEYTVFSSKFEKFLFLGIMRIRKIEVIATSFNVRNWLSLFVY